MFGSIHWLNTSFLLRGRMDTEENSQMSDIVEQLKHHSDTNLILYGKDIVPLFVVYGYGLWYLLLI